MRYMSQLTPSIASEIESFLHAKRFPSSESFDSSRESLLRFPQELVSAQFCNRLTVADENMRCRLIERYALLYREASSGFIAQWINDISSTVRWGVCRCLADYGNVSSIGILRHVMLRDSDCQVRVEATSALGSIGAADVLADLHHVSITDFEVDQLGYTPASCAFDAITDVLQAWATQQIRGNPSMEFRQRLDNGELYGQVLGQGICVNAEGQLHKVARYSGLPRQAFGHGRFSKLELQTALLPVFEVLIEYQNQDIRQSRIFIYKPLSEPTDELDWAIHTIQDTASCLAHLRTS